MISVEAVPKKLLKLNVSKSYGPDELHSGLLKELGMIIANPITLLF